MGLLIPGIEVRHAELAAAHDLPGVGAAQRIRPVVVAADGVRLFGHFCRLGRSRVRTDHKNDFTTEEFPYILQIVLTILSITQFFRSKEVFLCNTGKIETEMT